MNLCTAKSWGESMCFPAPCPHGSPWQSYCSLCFEWTFWDHLSLLLGDTGGNKNCSAELRVTLWFGVIVVDTPSGF